MLEISVKFAQTCKMSSNVLSMYLSETNGERSDAWNSESESTRDCAAISLSWGDSFTSCSKVFKYWKLTYVINCL